MGTTETFLIRQKVLKPTDTESDLELWIVLGLPLCSLLCWRDGLHSWSNFCCRCSVSWHALVQRAKCSIYVGFQSRGYFILGSRAAALEAHAHHSRCNSHVRRLMYISCLLIFVFRL